jgi:hypothetical protein
MEEALTLARTFLQSDASKFLAAVSLANPFKVLDLSFNNKSAMSFYSDLSLAEMGLTFRFSACD